MTIKCRIPGQDHLFLHKASSFYQYSPVFCVWEGGGGSGIVRETQCVRGGVMGEDGLEMGRNILKNKTSKGKEALLTG